jgi:hypothetical protein
VRQEEAIASRRFIRAFVDRDLETLDAAGEENFRTVTAAMAACFTALVRARIPAGQVANVAAGTTLYDSEDHKIPTWVVEAVFRGVLDDPRMMEGVAPGLLIDTQLAYVVGTAQEIPVEERDQLVEAASDILDGLRDTTPGTR